MPLIFPPSPTNGQTYTDDNSVVWQFNGTVWNVVTGTVKKLFNGVQVELSDNYFLTDTATAVNWDQTTYNTNNYWSVAQASRIVMPSTGYYTVNAVLVAPNVGAGYVFTIKKNGTTNITDVVLNANQTGDYNETNFFTAGDYIEIYASETTSTGYISTESYLAVTLLGLAVGAGISPANAFSGARVILTTAYNTTSTPTAMDWDATDFDVNANALALTYWNSLVPARLTVLTSGFYQIATFMQTEAGVGGSYTITLKKNGTNLSTATVGSNDVLTLDQIYQLAANDYIEMFVSDTLSSGQITTDSYLEIQRLGIA